MSKRTFLRGAPCAGCNERIWGQPILAWDLDHTYESLFHRRCEKAWGVGEQVGIMHEHRREHGIGGYLTPEAVLHLQEIESTALRQRVDGLMKHYTTPGGPMGSRGEGNP